MGRSGDRDEECPASADRLLEMDPETFVRFVADLWERYGWETRVVGAPDEPGIDVLATIEGSDKMIIQAKRRDPGTAIDADEVQEDASLRIREPGADRVAIVTTGEFSAEAEALAPDLNVILVDRAALLDLVAELDAESLLAAYANGEDPRTVRADDADEGIIARLRAFLGDRT